MIAISLLFLINIEKNFSETQHFTLNPIFNLLFFFVTIISMTYIHFNYNFFKLQIGIPNAPMIWSGLCVIIVVLISTIKEWGLVMPSLAIISLLYAYLGYYIPGFFWHAGIPLERTITMVSTTFQGIYGLLAYVSANTISMFCLLLGMMGAFGMMDVIVKFTSIVGTKVRSGDAQVVVLSGAFVGLVTGSTTANVTMIGGFGLPLMKRRGYTKEFAAGVAAASATGGAVMPPMMNAAAFIIAAWIGISYFRIVLVGFTPAILYYLGIALLVYIRALKLGIEKSHVHRERMSRGEIIIASLFFTPIAIIMYLLAKGNSPQCALFYAIMSTIVVGIIREYYYAKGENHIMIVSSILKKIYKGFENGGKIIVPLAVVLGTMGIVVQVLLGTGLTSKISQFAVNLAGGNLVILSIMIAGICTLFGMGMPSAPAYVMAAMLGAPALITFGIPVLAAHFFVFYFGEMSAITPPVALAALVAAKMAGNANFMKTCYLAIRLGIMGFAIPFFFLWKPDILLTGTALGYFWALFVAVMFLISFIVATENYLLVKLHIWERISFAIAAIFTLIHLDFLNYTGITITIVLLILHIFRNKLGFKEISKKEYVKNVINS